MTELWKEQVQPFDERRDFVVPGDRETTEQFCVQQFVSIAREAIAERGAFYVALAGGSTPKAIFEKLAEDPIAKDVQWSKVWLFWSDERSVPPNHPDSNYRMAMQSGLNQLGIPEEQTFRMPADESLEHGASRYEALIREKVPDQVFDLIQLGMGDDGHTASLFPETHALHTQDRLVVSNFVPQKDTWRMTFTYALINRARVISIYVLGAGKADILPEVLEGPYQPDHLPSQRVGTRSNHALWIMDQDASSKILESQGLG